MMQQALFGLRAGGLLLLWIVALPLQAMSFEEALRLALQQDAEYLLERDRYLIEQQQIKVARAVLLPSLTFSHERFKRDTDYLTTSNGTEYDAVDKLDGTSTSLVLSQPLFDYQRYASYQSARRSAEAARNSLDGKRQQLGVRLYEAYSRAVIAWQRLTLNQSQIEAYQVQLVLNQQLIQEGEGTQTDLLETRSRLSLAEAEQLDARNELAQALNALGLLVGQELAAEQLQGLPDQAGPALECTGRFEDWQARLLSDNPELQVLQQRIALAEYSLKGRRAGHYPRLTAYAQWVETEYDENRLYERTSNATGFGMQLTLPLFSGGGVVAGTRQEALRLDMRQRELDKRRQELVMELRHQLNLCVSAEPRLLAYQRAVEAAQALLEATRLSVAGGERINQDVLNAEQQLYTARLRLLTAQRDTLLARFRLLSLTGSLVAP